MMLSFLSPWWSLALLGAVGLPLAAHLLSRRRYLPMMFPATRFVARAMQDTTRVERPRQWLLLLLRVLALAAVVAAFMQPRWHRSAVAAEGQGQCVVMILDRSASMRRAEGGVTLFDQARQAAEARLGALDPGSDTAWVILAGRSPVALLPEPGANLSELRSRLRAAACGYETADLQTAMDLAAETLRGQGRPGRIVVFSDGQAGSRPPDGLSVRTPGVALEFVRFGPAVDPNVSLRVIDVTPFPPAAGLPVSVTVSVTNYGNQETPVALYAEGGGDASEVRLALPARSDITQVVELNPTVEGGSVFRFSAETGDGFPLDDASGFFSVVSAARRVVLVTDEPGLGRDTAAGRIALALAPDEAASKFHVFTADPGHHDRWGEWTDDPTACWVVCEPSGFSDALAPAMRGHLEAGGGVLWVADSAGSVDMLSRLAFAPLTLDGGSNSAGAVASARFDHEALRVFEGPARASLVGWGLAGVATGKVRSNAAVLLATVDGRPILAVGQVGRGRFAVLNATLTPGITDAASQPAFVPLVNELVRYLAPGPGLPPALTPGDALPASLADAGNLMAPEPFDYQPSAHAPGAYLALDPDGRATDGRWVDLDPAESDLTAVPLHPSQIGNELTPVSGRGLQVVEHDGSDLWPFLIVAAMLLLGVESLLLLGFARKEASG